MAQPGYSSENLHAALSAVGAELPERDGDMAFMREHLNCGEEAVKWRGISLRWAAGVLFGLAAYLAQKGIDRSDGNLLGAAMFPLLGTGATGLCLSAYERGVRSTYNLAQAVLQSRSAALQTPSCERCETCEDARAQMVVADIAVIGCGQSVSALGRFRALPNSRHRHSAVDLNEWGEARLRRCSAQSPLALQPRPRPIQ